MHSYENQSNKNLFIPGGAPIKRETEWDSVYSLISIRIIDLVESNNSNANVFANSVFPTPVGPNQIKKN
jgi:hypothetical protein